MRAPNGQIGLEILSREPVDLVIADLRMPMMDGVEFLQRLRHDHPKLKCIAMAGHGVTDITRLFRQHVCAFLNKPFTAEELRSAVTSALGGCAAADVEVLSARPAWVELRVPCDLAGVPPLQELVSQLQVDLPNEVREAVAFAFREMLNNAIEHGCRLDRAKRVEVRYVRFKRSTVCWIKDPGEGFDPARLEHAAIGNPNDDPFRHVFVREQRGLRSGGFGLLVTNQLVDELVYNEQHNELMFVKYLS
jgi:CheY-like chemotaxis protein/anti-sigma regulatory factor (Ser/Thr protein kinase)